MNNKQAIRQLAIAIYTINRHAKTAPDNKQLYTLKKMALDKLIRTGKAEKLGLHFVENPKFSKQHSALLVRCDEFLFHTIPDKEDFKTLPHLGQQDAASRNPQERMSLKTARDLLSAFVNPHAPIIEEKKSPALPKKRRMIQNTQTFRSSYLDGK
ncbi:YkyB family protein [Sporosarcina soli]|uniref:YkyB family protein n=1 Tax=Sporosarcina soli TaxID=334736 RepID=A0ABW0TIM5_9BACL